MNQEYESTETGYPSFCDAMRSEQTLWAAFPTAGRSFTVDKRSDKKNSWLAGGGLITEGRKIREHAAGDNAERVFDTGATALPGRCDPVFCIPPWMPPPNLPPLCSAARSAATVADLPHAGGWVVPFSRGGGPYVGRNTGKEVLPKEGRLRADLEGGLW